MDAGKFRTSLETRIVHYDGVTTPKEMETVVELFLLDVADMKLPWELKDTPAEQFLFNAIALAKTGDASAAPKVRDLLEKILRYMAAEGIPRDPATQ